MNTILLNAVPLGLVVIGVIVGFVIGVVFKSWFDENEWGDH